MSVNSKDMSTDGRIKEAIDALREAMEAGLIRYEFKSDTEKIEREVKEINQGLSATQGDVELLKEKTEKDLKETSEEMAAL